MEGLSPTTGDDQVLEEPDLAASETVYATMQEVDSSAEAQKYLAGFIAHKLKEKHPELSAEGTMEEEVDCPWIDVLSRGGLRKPSPSWLEQFLRFEGEFHNVHGMSISRKSQVIKKMESHLHAKFPDVPADIIALYAKTRTHIRIKYMRRQYKSNAEVSRNQKKLKHFAT